MGHVLSIDVMLGWLQHMGLTRIEHEQMHQGNSNRNLYVLSVAMQSWIHIRLWTAYVIGGDKLVVLILTQEGKWYIGDVLSEPRIAAVWVD